MPPSRALRALPILPLTTLFGLLLAGCATGAPDSKEIPCLAVDGDRDGWLSVSSGCPEALGAVDDCDDADPTIHIEAEDPVGDGVDQDCDGEDGPNDNTTTDGDDTGSSDTGSSDTGSSDTGVTPGDADADGFAAADDCDETDATVHPGADERCDGRDDDCDGETDENASDALLWFVDADADGVGDVTSWVLACTQPNGTVTDPGDCDDTDAAVYPGAPEVAGNGIDDDCDGESDVLNDADGDGWSEDGGDCDDADAAVSPDAIEVCNGLDDDCDGATDDADVSLDPASILVWYADDDGDTFGDDARVITACVAPAGHVASGGDCDDADALVSPDASEPNTEDGVDNDCDGLVDEGSLSYDDDADGYSDDDGDCDDGEVSANPAAAEVLDTRDNNCDGVIDEGTDAYDDDGDGQSERDGDCDDTDATTYVGAPEQCDGADHDCDGAADSSSVPIAYFADADGDGFASEVPSYDCDPGDGDALVAGEDCDDGDASVHPDAAETCDAADVDEDCDGAHDEPGAALGAVYYGDTDGDGDGDPAAWGIFCELPAGYSASHDDCDDADPAVYSGAPEICDGFANDCGSPWLPTDEDGLVSFRSEGGAWMDVTSTYAAGTRADPAVVTLSESGELAFCEGVFYVHLTVDADLVLTGVGAGESVLDGGDSGTVIELDDDRELTASGVTLQHGYSTGDGGGLYAYPGVTISLTDVELAGNAAYRHGGGLYVDGANEVMLDDVVFTDNEAITGAAGGAAIASASVMITRSNFTDNRTVPGSGGGLYLSSPGSVEACTFSGNTAMYGGGMYLTGSETDVVDTTFDANHAYSLGGGARADYDAAFFGGLFNNNTSDGSGGGLVLYGGVHTVRGTEFRENEGDGAALYAEMADVALSDVTMSANTAGGGVGGALRLVDAVAVATSSVFSGNSANDGGAFYIDDAGSSTLDLGAGTIVQDNVAQFTGGAVTMFGAADLVIDGAVIEANLAGTNGGAVYASGGSGYLGMVTCRGGTITGNSATGDGFGASISFGTGSLDSDGCSWGADQEIYVSNVSTSFVPFDPMWCDTTSCR